MIPAIFDRRSIRKFISTPLAEEDIRDILQSGICEKKKKNRQPWKFVVVQGKAKEEMIRVFRQGICREENGEALLPQSRAYLSSAKYTVDVMEQAPVILFILNPLGKELFAPLTPEERIYEVCNIQSLSAAIENMLLAAQEKGIGSLWICDIFFAYPELCQWLGQKGELLAAVAFGYAAESPGARPRKSLEEVVEWRR